ncbi:hypothetical protein [Pacificibacter marinus]|uniref:hypothetical protein n=1 Tax=Pacificibacter marinus TaxID=658057 RepID=UPI001C077365|nr:hypothetical protein [Pacificibacter marinus]MBU2866898.1 hypothetical protein [Pacificibacter marinus]
MSRTSSIELGAYVLALHLIWEDSVTTRLISSLLETRQAAEVAYLAKIDAETPQRLEGLPRQMFDHLTADELAEMAMIHAEQSEAA